MCIFSADIQKVRGTQIFARLDGQGNQYLAYSMEYSAVSDMAMILPLPVSSHAEDAVQFLSLEGYAGFFGDLHSSFVAPSLSRGVQSLGMEGARVNLLQVHDVGAYEASFIPTLDDFDRLDPRFKLPRQVWDQIPIYVDYGFAVFKLRASAKAEGEDPALLNRGQKHDGRYTLGELPPSRPVARAHPMAFLFPTRAMNSLFFPTVHIHDGQYHPNEHFDHWLFFQDDMLGEAYHERGRAVKSNAEMNAFMTISQAQGMVDGEKFCFRCKLRGSFPNEDVWAGPSGILPVPV